MAGNSQIVSFSLEHTLALALGILVHLFFSSRYTSSSITWRLFQIITSFASGYFIPNLVLEVFGLDGFSDKAKAAITFLAAVYGGTFMGKGFVFLKDKDVTELLQLVLKKATVKKEQGAKND